MCYETRNWFIKGILISIWTIVQTSFHIIFVLGGYYVCQFKPSHYILFIFYITYFYDYDKCGSISLGEASFFSLKQDRNSTRLIDLEANATDDDYNIYDIIHTISEKAIFPRESSQHYRTQLYLYCYAICDGCWLLSAFLLFVGICFNVKKCLSIIFYGPWLLVTGVSVLLDATAAVHFGLDLLQISNYTSWLRFIGVTNYQDFKKFNESKSSAYVPHISTITMTLFWSRLCLFWILNIVHFFSVVNSFGVAFRGIPGKRNIITARRSNAHLSTNQMNSSESRIRNWQMFYGAVETNSSRSSVSSKSIDRDYNSNSNNKNSKRKNSEERPKKVSGNSTTRYSLDSNIDFLSSANSSPKPNSNYLKFQDVTEGVNTNSLYRRDSGNEFEINQRPWSYLRFNERPPSVLLEHGEGSRVKQASLELNRLGSTAM